MDKVLEAFENRKTTKHLIVDQLLTNGFVLLDEGNCRFMAVQLTKKKFPTVSDALLQQLKQEGKQDYYITLITSRDSVNDIMSCLPIYGDATKYVTKWFVPDIDTTTVLKGQGDSNLIRRVEYYYYNMLGKYRRELAAE